ncbi:hypothetical protein ES703_57759 [subsurface metagenome]
MSVNGVYALINGILNQLKNLSASWVTSGQFPFDRMPRAASGVLTAKGVGVNPAYEAAPGGGGATGSYAGNAGNNRQISTGFLCSMGIILDSYTTPNPEACRIITLGRTVDLLGAVKTDARPHATDGLEVDSGVNVTGHTYYYSAV